MRVIVKEKKETGISLAGFSVAFGSTGFPVFPGPELGNREGLLRYYIKKSLPFGRGSRVQGN